MIEDTIRAAALRNAILHNGKAHPKAVLGQLLAINPKLKKEAATLLPRIEAVTGEVNSLDLESQQEALSGYDIKFKTAEKEKEGLPDLENAKKVVMRFAPAPSGPLHIGHARTVVLNGEYVKKYGGKFILRFEDTDPNNIFPEAYDWIPEEIEWFGYKIDKIAVQSDNILSYYKHAKRVLEGGDAYICTCPQNKFKKLVESKKPCPCRDRPPEYNLERWDWMFSKYKPGDAVMRIKTDMDHPNPAMRDWPAARIIDTPHPKTKTKYRVWPLYNFSNVIDDHELQVTHILRGKDHEDNTRRQAYLFNYLGWKQPITIHHGRLKIDEAEVILSKTKTRKLIAEGKYSGWDDPRLATIHALRRRGIQPEAIRLLMANLGIGKVDIAFSLKTLYTANRKIVENSSRYFFVPNPKLINIESKQQKIAKVPYHPDHSERGFRIFKINPIKGYIKVSVPADDLKDVARGTKLRLIDLANLEFIGKTKAKEIGGDLLPKKIQWLPDGLECFIRMPDGKTVKGICDPEASQLDPGTVIQFVRFGFVRLDSKKPLIFYFSHQ